MKAKKFEKRMAEAKGDAEKKQRLFAEILSEEPSERAEMQLDELEDEMAERDVMDALIRTYAERSRKLDALRYSMLTGRGQCQGRLVVYGGDVVMCCCDKMAKLVVEGRGHYMNHAIRLSAKESVPEEHEGAKYMVKEPAEYAVDGCPFCRAHIGVLRAAPKPGGE